ncbi:MAG: hypothetical protein GDA51_05400 [Ekhidna sp.]|nr:hypothetical protein [Ekhidna sp.]MBC6425897.1 hypothetical protein [Ekhidna sp.]
METITVTLISIGVTILGGLGWFYKRLDNKIKESNIERKEDHDKLMDNVREYDKVTTEVKTKVECLEKGQGRLEKGQDAISRDMNDNFRSLNERFDKLYDHLLVKNSL